MEWIFILIIILSSFAFFEKYITYWINYLKFLVIKFINCLLHIIFYDQTMVLLWNMNKRRETEKRHILEAFGKETILVERKGILAIIRVIMCL